MRENAEEIAKDNGIEIKITRKLHAFRKDDRIQQIISETGKKKGLIHIFSAMECCNIYRPWHDKKTGETFLKFDKNKCLHYYFDFIDKDFGLCYLHVPTWCPFRLQFYMNGQNLLVRKLEHKGISYETSENAFVNIENPDFAQKLSDHVNLDGLHKALDAFAECHCPIVKELGLAYS